MEILTLSTSFGVYIRHGNVFKFPHDVYNVINPFQKSRASLQMYNLRLPRKACKYLIFYI